MKHSSVYKMSYSKPTKQPQISSAQPIQKDVILLRDDDAAVAPGHHTALRAADGGEQTEGRTQRADVLQFLLGSVAFRFVFFWG